MNGPVICGIEDAEEDGAAGVARELSERYGLPLLFVQVLRDGGEDGTAREATALEHGELRTEIGHPADRLVELAREQEASFLVVGNRGPRSSLLGSISADVSRRAPCPVVVVPPAAAASRAQAGGSDPLVRGGIVRFGVGRAARRVA